MYQEVDSPRVLDAIVGLFCWECMIVNSNISIQLYRCYTFVYHLINN